MADAGVFMLGIDGLALTAEERELLSHPLVGGVVLFSRNYREPAQLRALCDDVHALQPRLQIAVDQESADVQRLCEHFTALPQAAAVGRRYDRDRDEALAVARACGRVVARELQDVGVDFSFAPVLDVDTGASGVIGARAFHRDPHAVAALGGAFIEGLHDAGMVAVGKHFPGHGSAFGDTHDRRVLDERSFDAIAALDLQPFETLAARRLLDAVMLSHVVYSAVADEPASLSRYWLRDVLRGRLGFGGVAFTDDLAMDGSLSPDAAALKRALDAGCDVALVCNNRAMARQLMAGFDDAEVERYGATAARRWASVRSARAADAGEAFDYSRAVALLERFAASQR